MSLTNLVSTPLNLPALRVEGSRNSRYGYFIFELIPNWNLKPTAFAKDAIAQNGQTHHAFIAHSPLIADVVGGLWVLGSPQVLV